MKQTKRTECNTMGKHQKELLYVQILQDGEGGRRVALPASFLCLKDQCCPLYDADQCYDATS